MYIYLYIYIYIFLHIQDIYIDVYLHLYIYIYTGIYTYVQYISPDELRLPGPETGLGGVSTSQGKGIPPRRTEEHYYYRG